MFNCELSKYFKCRCGSIAIDIYLYDKYIAKIYFDNLCKIEVYIYNNCIYSTGHKFFDLEDDNIISTIINYILHEVAYSE